MIVDMKNIKTGEWLTVLSDPLPDLMMSAITLLKFDEYNMLLDEFGSRARNRLPEVEQIGARRQSPHSGKSFRIEDISSLPRMEANNWWPMAGGVLGWSKKQTYARLRSDNDPFKFDEAMAKLLEESRQLLAEDEPLMEFLKKKQKRMPAELQSIQ